MGILSFLDKKAKPVVGLDISSTSVKLLELSRSGDRYRVESYTVKALPPNAVVEKNIADPVAVAEVVRSMVKQSKTKLKHAAVAVAGSAVITKMIDMPMDLNDDAMESQIAAEADQYIPFPLGEVALDFEVQGISPRNPDQVEVLLAACRRENVEVRQQVLADSDLIAEKVDIEAYCMERAFELIA